VDPGKEISDFSKEISEKYDFPGKNSDDFLVIH